MTTLKKVFPVLTRHIPTLLRLQGGAELPLTAADDLKELGLSDEDGITRKGRRVLDHLLAIADLLDIPYS